MCKVAILGILICSGCVQLTDSQRVAVGEANAQIVSIESRVETLEPILADLCAKIKDVTSKIADGELPKAEGKALLILYKGKKDVVKAELKAAVAEATLLAETVKAINDAGVPWYQQLWLLLPGILCGVAAYSKNKQLRIVSTAFGAVSRGVDAAMDGMTKKTSDKIKSQIALEVGNKGILLNVKKLHAESHERKI